jgi:hypothetical protein
MKPPCDLVRTYQKPFVRSKFWRIFTEAKGGVSTNHNEGNSEEGFKKRLQTFVSNFMEATKKFIQH